MSATCGGCSERWGGLAQAHCSFCHRTFSTAGNFDAHQRPIRSDGTPGCSTRGFVQDGSGVWHRPGPESGSDSYRASGKGQP